MKRRKKKPADLFERFQSTCGWCGRTILPNTPVYGGSAKARPGVDLSPHEGHIIPMRLVAANKTVLIGIPARDSEAKRAGADIVFMACSKACARELQEAFLDDIDLGNLSRQGEAQESAEDGQEHAPE